MVGKAGAVVVLESLEGMMMGRQLEGEATKQERQSGMKCGEAVSSKTASYLYYGDVR